MNQNFSSQLQLSLAIVTLLLTACDPKEESSPGAYDNGVFITNEGGLGNSNGSISFYSNTTDSVYNNIFTAVNGRSLGDVVQSIMVHENSAYIVVNNSHKIEVADASTFLEKGVISEVNSPRYMVAKGNTAYVSCWDDNSVKIIDLEDNTVLSSVSVASGPEKMLIQNNKLYVTNSGGWGTDSIVSIIDLTDNSVVKSLLVGYSPQDIVVDNDGFAWVLCSGKIVYGNEDPLPIVEETASQLYKINTGTDQIVLIVDLFATQHPTNLEIDNSGNLYIGGGYGFQGIYKLEVSTGSAEVNQIIADWIYGFNIDPKEGILYGTLVPSWTDGGQLKRFTTDGTELGTYTCGIGPSSASFKNAR